MRANVTTKLGWAQGEHGAPGLSFGSSKSTTDEARLSCPIAVRFNNIRSIQAIMCRDYINSSSDARTDSSESLSAKMLLAMSISILTFPIIRRIGFAATLASSFSWYNFFFMQINMALISPRHAGSTFSRPCLMIILTNPKQQRSGEFAI